MPQDNWSCGGPPHRCDDLDGYRECRLQTTGSAADIISELQGQGYDVQLNGQPNGALAQCTVTGVHQTARAPNQVSTLYVDIDCPGSN